MSTPLPSYKVVAGELLQHVSRSTYRGTALYFGRDGTNRYDSPDKDYGVLYLAFDLPTALMESVFHKHLWHRRKNRPLAIAEVKSRIVRAVGVMSDLTLADLTANGVIAQNFGLNMSQLSSRRYVHTRQISKKVHAMKNKSGAPVFDGLVYPSHNNYPERCIALFDRALHAVQVVDDIDLADHVGWPGFVASYCIGIM